jgi:hypothetical protein
MNTEEIANRHLLAVDGLQISPRTEEQRIRIVVADGWASSHAGQLLTSCLVNLLCRQVKLVRHIEVIAPEGPVLIKLPCGDPASRFPTCLEDLATWAVSGAVSLTTQQFGTVDHTVFVGEAPQETDQNSGIVTIGNGWKAWLGEVSHARPNVVPTSQTRSVLFWELLLRQARFSNVVGESDAGDFCPVTAIPFGPGRPRSTGLILKMVQR